MSHVPYIRGMSPIDETCLLCLLWQGWEDPDKRLISTMASYPDWDVQRGGVFGGAKDEVFSFTLNPEV